MFFFSLSVCATGVTFRKQCPVSMRSSVLLTFTSMGFSMDSFMMKSLIPLGLTFVHGCRSRSQMTYTRINHTETMLFNTLLGALALASYWLTLTLT